ncbi:VirD4-like conjugal transfer protein, CD1115 family [Butyrivibrio sp. INlla16]|uniref:VirD4-like conjugal transfer protein, CD1115 family n=2 Tax=Butyrivibrio sp. INlla16 TaxID=1520807 RepID=UPI001FA7027C|nr:type IV secretory system conjugative DNA transfer family protein [Butyrivibrio sp. INlla16]
MDKKTLLLYGPYAAIGYVFMKIACVYNTGVDQGVDGFDYFMVHMTDIFRWPILSLRLMDYVVGVAGAAVFYGIVTYKKSQKKEFRKGREYGSARWGNAKDIEPFRDREGFYKNIPITATECLRMTPAESPKYERNKNILVIGGSGSGKTRFFVKPSIMQMHSSYVITDPKGTLVREVGTMLQKHGYNIRILNTVNFKKSNRYNPFAYIKSEKDILKLVNTIMVNTKGEGEQSGEDFWQKAERLLYCAYIGAIYYFCIESEQNFTTLLNMIDQSETKEDDEGFKNAIDLMFDELGEKYPDNFAVVQYRKYKLAAGKTAKSILISCGARLAPFDVAELRDLTKADELDLESIGTEKTALFVIISDTDDTFNFIVSIMYSQLFNVLCETADDVYNGKLPVPVRVLCDEFANIGQIPKFEKLIATIRSRQISASIILQSKSQLKALYKDNAQTIEGNCDTMLFLGGNEESTLKDLNTLLGKETIDLCNTSDTKGNNPTYGNNYQKTGRDLMTQDELAVMDNGKCICRIRGVRPFLSDKYDITKHPRYKELSDYDESNAFDVQDYLNLDLVLTPETVVNAETEVILEPDAKESDSASGDAADSKAGTVTGT